MTRNEIAALPYAEFCGEDKKEIALHCKASDAHLIYFALEQEKKFLSDKWGRSESVKDSVIINAKLNRIRLLMSQLQIFITTNGIKSIEHALDS